MRAYEKLVATNITYFCTISGRTTHALLSNPAGQKVTFYEDPEGTAVLFVCPSGYSELVMDSIMWLPGKRLYAKVDSGSSFLTLNTW